MTDAVKFANEQERELYALGLLGEQVKDFLVSPIGRYLHGRARNEIEQCEVDALEALKALDIPIWGRIVGRRKLRKIHQRAETAQNFMKWLADTIVDGESAYQALNE